MIRMPDTIRDADHSARNDKLSLSMAQSSTNVLPRENDSHSQERGGEIDQGPRYAAGRFQKFENQPVPNFSSTIHFLAGS